MSDSPSTASNASSLENTPSETATTSSTERHFAPRSVKGRRRVNLGFLWVCWATGSLALLMLLLILGAVFDQGTRRLTKDFWDNPPSADVEEAGIRPARGGTVWVCIAAAFLTLPMGVATAIFLEEYQPQSWSGKKIHGFIQLNITNLAGVPSVVYGILGLAAFAYMFGLFGKPDDPAFEIGVDYYYQYRTLGRQFVRIPAAPGKSTPRVLIDQMEAFAGDRVVKLHIIPEGDPLPRDREALKWSLRETAVGGRVDESRWYHLRLPFGRGVMAAALTLMLVILPILIVSTQEALRAVPSSLKNGALGLGATHWQTIWKITLPASLPGIMTGSILAMSRAIGEAAPLLMITGIVFITKSPENLMDKFTVMPLQIFNWAQRAQQPFHELAASGIIVLLVVLLLFNGVAIAIRYTLQKPLK